MSDRVALYFRPDAPVRFADTCVYCGEGPVAGQVSFEVRARQALEETFNTRSYRRRHVPDVPYCDVHLATARRTRSMLLGAGLVGAVLAVVVFFAVGALPWSPPEVLRFVVAVLAAAAGFRIGRSVIRRLIALFEPAVKDAPYPGLYSGGSLGVFASLPEQGSRLVLAFTNPRVAEQVRHLNQTRP